jgi:hypothetical protein
MAPRASTVVMAAALYCSVALAAYGYQPAVNYQLRCMGCHLADGSGQTGRVPSLRRSLVLFSGLPEGRNYVVRVPGVAQSPLSDEETAALLNWMARNLSDVALPRGFVDYSAGEIHGLRDRPLERVKDLRARLWKEADPHPRLAGH